MAAIFTGLFSQITAPVQSTAGKPTQSDGLRGGDREAV
jgi:hypothetical protein